MCGCRGKSGNKISTSGNRSNNTQNRNISQQMSELLLEVVAGEDFVDVIYNGSIHSHYIGSPTGIIRQYGILNYGYHKKGDAIRVHKDDLAKSNGILFIETIKPVREVQLVTEEVVLVDDIVVNEEEDTELSTNEVEEETVNEVLELVNEPVLEDSDTEVEDEIEEEVESEDAEKPVKTSRRKKK